MYTPMEFSKDALDQEELSAFENGEAVSLELGAEALDIQPGDVEVLDVQPTDVELPEAQPEPLDLTAAEMGAMEAIGDMPLEAEIPAGCRVGCKGCVGSHVGDGVVVRL